MELNERFNLTIVLKIEVNAGRLLLNLTRGVYFWNVTRGVYYLKTKTKKNTDSLLQEIFFFQWQQKVTQNTNFKNRFCASLAGGLSRRDARREISAGMSQAVYSSWKIELTRRRQLWRRWHKPGLYSSWKQTNATPSAFDAAGICQAFYSPCNTTARRAP
jgi:hypothetical protein